MRTALISLIIFLSSSGAFAGGNVIGNGGDLVICPNRVQKVTLLDFTESLTINQKIEIELGPAELSTDEKIQYFINRLAAHQPQRAQRLEREVKHLFRGMPFVDRSLEDIQDSDHLSIVIPTGCHIRQGAILFTGTLLPSDPRYLIDRNLYEQMDSLNQAGLILHEVLFREAVGYGHKNSVLLRRLLAHLSSRQFSQRTDKEVYLLFKNANFDRIEVQGLMITEWGTVYNQPPEFYPNKNLKSALAVADSSFRVQGVDIYIRDLVEFHPNKGIASAILNRPTRLKNQQGQWLDIPKNAIVEFSQQGLVTKVF